MPYQTQLQFTRDLLTRLHVSSCIIQDPADRIPSDIDLGLRSLLYGTDNYHAILEGSISTARENTIYRFLDEYDCKYIFMRLPNEQEETFFFIGPYLLDIPNSEYISKISSNLALSSTQQQQLYIYYTDLPVIEDENWLLTIANTLGSAIWGTDSQYVMEYVNYRIPDRSTPIPVAASPTDPYDAPVSLSILETTYQNEKLLMEAVRNGNLHVVTTVAASVFNSGTEPRLADSLRDRKNYLIILKTLLRKSAEYGGVHPLHIHRLSSVYARRIEQIHTIKESLHLQEEMIREYCQLVKNYSLSGYSYYVGRAITLIHYDPTADLSLKSISSQLNVNGSYLSNLFHKECGCTLTEYVNRQRIKRAVMLLHDSKKTIQDIANESGFQDTTYFIRLFKKYTGKTPARYRDELDLSAAKKI